MHFGLEPRDAPMAVIHATRPSDRKYLLRRADRAAGLTEGGVRRMVDDFLAGRLPVIGGNDSDDEDGE